MGGDHQVRGTEDQSHALQQVADTGIASCRARVPREARHAQEKVFYSNLNADASGTTGNPESQLPLGYRGNSQ